MEALPAILESMLSSLNCQLFSIDRTGRDLRQLTTFYEVPDGKRSRGCSFGRLPGGCHVFYWGRDILTDAVVFYSGCDPFGTNPNGSQLFAIHRSGTGLNQLTNTRGYMSAGGAVTVELPYSFAYPGFQFRNEH